MFIRLIRYQKTIGSMIMVMAFAFQWYGDNYFKPNVEQVFSDASHAVAEVRVLSFEILFQETNDLALLSSALNTLASVYGDLLHSGAFEDAPDERFQPILEIQLAEPSSFEEYTQIKSAFLEQMGALWRGPWLSGAAEMQESFERFRTYIFAFSVLGLLLIWNHERREVR